MVGSSLGVFVEISSVKLDWCACRSVGERKMWGQVGQQEDVGAGRTAAGPTNGIDSCWQ